MTTAQADISPVTTPRLPGVRKAQPLALRRRAGRREVAAAAIAEAHTQLLANLHGLQAHFAPKLVHQARVALRRQRVWLRLFRSVIGKERADALRGELRWLFGLLGALRDLQVFDQTYLQDAEQRGRRVELLRASVDRQQQEARTQLEKALGDTRHQLLLQRMAALGGELSVPRDDERPARSWLAGRLERRHRALLGQQDALTSRDPEALHTLRKGLKKLRYTAELASDLYPKRKERVRRYLADLRALQDALGGFMDQHVAREVLDRLPPAGGLQRTLRERMDREAATHLQALTEALPRFAAHEPFWR